MRAATGSHPMAIEDEVSILFFPFVFLTSVVSCAYKKTFILFLFSYSFINVDLVVVVLVINPVS